MSNTEQMYKLIKMYHFAQYHVPISLFFVYLFFITRCCQILLEQESSLLSALHKELYLWI